MLFLRGVMGAALGAALVSAAVSQSVEVSFNLPGTNGGPTELTDTYLFFANFPSVTTEAVAFSEGTISSGTSVTVENPAEFGTAYSYIFMGLYLDPLGAPHVAVGTENDLSGDSWDTLFNSGFQSFSEPSIISDLESGNPSKSASLASDVLSFFVPGVDPVLSYSASSVTANVTGFSNGVHIGSITSAEPTPEPSTLLVLGLFPLGLLRRRKRR